MTPEQQTVVRQLIEEGEKRFHSSRERVDFGTGIAKCEELLNDIEGHPHLFVLACVMDRQIRADRAWLIPYKIGTELGSFSFRRYVKLSQTETMQLFSANNLHRFNAKMAGCFYSAVQYIQLKYDGEASRIWTGKPKSATVIRRFLEFSGVGPKIATMATNLLALHFKVPMEEYSSIDISPDVQVKKFFTYHGLLRPNAKTDEVVFLARELHPSCPGILDLAAWTAGRKLK